MVANNRSRSRPSDARSRPARISLGGVQEKMVVVIDGVRLGVPVGVTPSTHILKPA
jgi:serine/threonine-protein kinase HipA